jgi:antitoxin component YwqK of YwqJK toxin-antitoxin module
MARPSSVLLSLLIACRAAETSAPDEARQGSPAPITCPAGATMRGVAPPSGDRVWCESDDGTLEGPVREWFADGQRRLEGEYAAGQKHGAWKTFYAGGKPRAEEHWDAGKPTGTWVTWFADGTRATEALHRPGGVVAFRSFRPDGSKQRQGTYANGRENGEWTEWDPAGVATVAIWKDGVKTTATPTAIIGIAECDEYITKYMRCIAEKVPDAARGTMNEAMDATIKAWREAAANTQQHEALRVGCKAALDAARQATEAMGCTW